MADDKDWTWVLDEACGECGYEANSLAKAQLGPRIRAVAGEWREMLNRGMVVTQAPHGDRTWSILEYGCHVRDVFELFNERLSLMLKKRKTPTFKDWNQDQAAVDGDYANEDPAKVAYALASSAGKFADIVDRLNDDEWAKQGLRSDGAAFTVESFTRYLLHDVEHHLWDTHQILDGG